MSNSLGLLIGQGAATILHAHACKKKASKKRKYIYSLYKKQARKAGAVAHPSARSHDQQPTAAARRAQQRDVERERERVVCECVYSV